MGKYRFKPTCKVTFNADGTVYHWNMFCQAWETSRPEDISYAVLSTFSAKDRRQILDLIRSKGSN